MRHKIPMPPARLIDGTSPAAFVPAIGFRPFLDDQLLNESSPLYNPEHGHLEQASIGFLWTTFPNSRRGKVIAGEAEQTDRYKALSAGKWLKARIEQQVFGWFGEMPDFVVTFNAFIWSELDDAGRLCLMEHELYHCGQALDEFQLPKWHRDGTPVFAIRGHDIEEFAGVVRRYGIEATGQDRIDFVAAAIAEPEISRAAIRETCGVCV